MNMSPKSMSSNSSSNEGDTIVMKLNENGKESADHSQAKSSGHFKIKLEEFPEISNESLISRLQAKHHSKKEVRL
jgi:hypothetical protein